MSIFEFEYFHPVFSFHIVDPLHSLELGVDEQRPPVAFGSYQSIFLRHSVTR